MTFPLIGLTSSRNKKVGRLELLEAYTRAVLSAGGIPLIIPLELSPEGVEQLAGRLDGVLFTGGGDIDIVHFGGRHHPRISSVEPLRDQLEILLVQVAVARCLPFLGICRGIQVINVALGGTLYTDISSQFPGAVRHDFFSPHFPRNHIAHEVHVDPGSALASILGSGQLMVNSLHHQGLERIAAGLRVSARAPDGVVEGVELSAHPFGLGVQWHPECLPDSLPDRALFQAFVAAAAQRGRMT